MALIYDKSGEKVLILATREAHYRPFTATDWTDLRIGFFLSLTKPSPDNDDPSTDPDVVIAETITGTDIPWTDRVQIGVIDSRTSTVFMGYSNLPSNSRTIISRGESELISSDIGTGTTNKRYWRPKHNGTPVQNRDAASLLVVDTGVPVAHGGDGSQMHFVRDPATAGGYCTLFALRLTRADARGRERIITMQVKKTTGGHSSDIIFTTTPTEAILQSQLASFPTDVQTLGPVELSKVPDTFWFYWPFSDSRLRIHCSGIYKAA
jgi:hypothetical protein